MQNARWLLIGLVCLGCSKKETPATPPSAEPLPSAAPAPSASAKVEETPSPFALVKKFESGKFFAVGSAAIVCESPCVFEKGAAPKVWLVQGSKVKEAPELWPGHAYQQYLQTLIDEDDGSAPVLYDGEYPNRLYAQGVSGSRTWPGLPAVKFNKKYWAESPNASVGRPEYRSRPLPPREYDEALMAAPVSYTPTARFFFGAGGPTIVLGSHHFFKWDGKAWSKKAAPWNETPEGLRLKDGSTLLTTDSGAFLVDREGKTSSVKLPDGVSKLTGHRIAGSVWLTASGDGVAVYRPTEASKFEVFDEPERKPHVAARVRHPRMRQMAGTPRRPHSCQRFPSATAAPRLSSSSQRRLGWKAPSRPSRRGCTDTPSWPAR